MTKKLCETVKNHFLYTRKTKTLKGIIVRFEKCEVNEVIFLIVTPFFHLILLYSRLPKLLLSYDRQTDKKTLHMREERRRYENKDHKRQL